MSIIRTVKREQFLVVHMSTIDDTSIDLDCKGLHVYLLGKPDNWEVNVKHIMKTFSVGRKKVYRILNDLIAAGYCRRVQDRSQGAFDSCTYEIYETKQQNDHTSPRAPKGHTVPTEPCAHKGDTDEAPITRGSEGVGQCNGGAQEEPCDPKGHTVEGVQKGSSVTGEQEYSQNESTVCPLGVYPSGAHITNNKYITNTLSPNTVPTNKTGVDEGAEPGERENPILAKEQKTPNAGQVGAKPTTQRTPSTDQPGQPPNYGVSLPANGESFVKPSWVLADLWDTWVEQRRTAGSYSESQKALECRRLAHLMAQGWAQHEILEDSIARDHKRLYAPCRPGAEKIKQNKPDLPAVENKARGGGKGAGVIDQAAQERRELIQEIKGFTDQLRQAPEGSRAYKGLQEIIEKAKAKLDSLGGGACS